MHLVGLQALLLPRLLIDWLLQSLPQEAAGREQGGR
jgi:hypothetical protein